MSSGLHVDSRSGTSVAPMLTVPCVLGRLCAGSRQAEFSLQCKSWQRLASRKTITYRIRTAVILIAAEHLPSCAGPRRSFATFRMTSSAATNRLSNPNATLAESGAYECLAGRTLSMSTFWTARRRRVTSLFTSSLFPSARPAIIGVASSPVRSLLAFFPWSPGRTPRRTPATRRKARCRPRKGRHGGSVRSARATRPSW